MSTVLLWLITSAFLLVGLVGSIVPGLPGIGFVFAGILFYALVSGFAEIAPVTVIIFGLVSLAAWLAAYFGSVIGAKAGGGRKLAIIGSITGAVIGITTGPGGLLAGAFIGSFIGSLIEGQSHQKAIKVALLSTIGVIGANLMQLLLSVIMVIAFLLSVWL